jgi:hypothetical protein
MVEYRLTFPAAISTEVRGGLMLEKRNFEKQAGSLREKYISKVANLAGLKYISHFSYKVISPTEIRLTILNTFFSGAVTKLALAQMRRGFQRIDHRIQIEEIKGSAAA